MINRVFEGKRAGMLTFVSRDTSDPKKWVVKCDCGTVKSVYPSNALNPKCKSCGCHKRTQAASITFRHGLSHTRVHRIWNAMLQRCRDGADTYCTRKGVTVCERWRVFENFLADMGQPPEGKSIDRINNDGNYEPGNCRWATPKEQANNRGRVSQ